MEGGGGGGETGLDTSCSGSVRYRGDVTYLNKTSLVYYNKTNFV